MKDRVASKPGRVLITPEDGSTPFYATMMRADEPTQAGDAPTKANLLTDETAALYDLDEDATVNEVLKKAEKKYISRPEIISGRYQAGTIPILNAADASLRDSGIILSQVPKAPYSVGNGNVLTLASDGVTVRNGGVSLKYVSRNWVVLYDSEDGELLDGVKDDDSNWYYDLALSDDLRNYGSFGVMCWGGTRTSSTSQSNVYGQEAIDVCINETSIGSQYVRFFFGSADHSKFLGRQYGLGYYTVAAPGTGSQVIVGNDIGYLTSASVYNIRIQFNNGTYGGLKNDPHVIVVAR